MEAMPSWQMEEPKADLSCVDETRAARGLCVVKIGDAAGVLQFAEAALDRVAQAVKGAIRGEKNRLVSKQNQ